MLEEVIAILLEFTKDKDLKINEESNLRDDLELNSIDYMELIISFEDEFEIEISDRKAASFQTVGDIIKFLETQK